MLNTSIVVKQMMRLSYVSCCCCQCHHKPPPLRAWIFLQFFGDLFVIVTLQQLRLSGPLYLTFSQCDPSCNLHIKTFTTISGPFTPWQGPFYSYQAPFPGWWVRVWFAPAMAAACIIAAVSYLYAFANCRRRRYRQPASRLLSVVCWYLLHVKQYLFIFWMDVNESCNKISSCECSLLKRFSSSQVKGQRWRSFLITIFEFYCYN